MESVIDWILTDDDTFQYVRKVDEYTFDLIEMTAVSFDNGEYLVYADTLHVDDYLKNKKGLAVDILNGFGYDSIEDVICQYGDGAMQIIAECIFEHFSFYQAENLFVGSEDACMGFIDNYIKIHQKYGGLRK